MGIAAAALVGALSGAIGGYFSGQAAGPSASEGELAPKAGSIADSKETDTAAPQGASLLPTRIHRSESQRIAALEHRVSLLTAALARGQSELVEDDSEDDSGVLDAVDVADPVFEAAVLDIMDREEERRDDERESRREDLVAERGRRLSSELTDSLGLSEAQQQRIAQVVADHFNGFRDLRSDDAPNRPITQRDWRERMEELNQKAASDLRGVLSPEQFEKYEQLAPEDQIFFGWGRGRGSSSGNERQAERSVSDAGPAR